jgi:hypothetical protein
MHQSLRMHELVPLRADIVAGLAKYQPTVGVQAAVRIAGELFEYRAHPCNRSARQMQEQFQRLHAHGVTPWDILQRLAEVFAFIEQAPLHRFENADVQAITLARAVLQLVSLGKWRANGHMLRFMGHHLMDALGVFALNLVRRLEQDRLSRRALINESANFDKRATI